MKGSLDFWNKDIPSNFILRNIGSQKRKNRLKGCWAAEKLLLRKERNRGDEIGLLRTVVVNLRPGRRPGAAGRQKTKKEQDRQLIGGEPSRKSLKDNIMSAVETLPKPAGRLASPRAPALEQAEPDSRFGDAVSEQGEREREASSGCAGEGGDLSPYHRWIFPPTCL